MTVDDAIDRLTTIDQLPEVGPDLVQEASDLLDVIEARTTGYDHNVVTYATTVYRETVNRAVDWNP